jgi:glutamine synthetase type III
MSKFIPQPKQKAERVRIKPPTQRVIKYKITPEIRKYIKELAASLPPTPYLIKNGNGISLQHIKKTTLLTNEEVAKLEKKDIPEEKVEFEPGSHRIWVNKGSVVRMMNHQVILTAMYEEHGTKAFTNYEDQVRFIQSIINPKKEETTTENV